MRAIAAGFPRRTGCLARDPLLFTIALVPAALAVACPAAAVAQSGVSGGGRTAEVQVTGRVTYDSNLARGGAVVQTVKDVRPDDIIYTPSVRINLGMPIARQSVFLTGSAGYDFHQFNKQLDSERLDFVGGGMGAFGPCGAGLNAGYQRRQSDQSELDLTVTGNKQQTVSVGAQLSCEVAAGLAPSVSVQHFQTENTAERGVVNSNQTVVTGAVSYGNRRTGNIELLVGYSHAEYDEVALVVRAPTPNFDTFNAGVRYSRPIGTRLTGRASLSYLYVKSDAERDEGYSGPSGTGALSYRVNPRMGVNLTYEVGALPSMQQGSSYVLTTALAVDANYRFSSRLRGALGARWGDRSYEDQAQQSSLDVSDEKTRAIFGSVSYEVGRSATVSLDARHEVRQAEPALFDYDAYRVTLTATKTF